MALKFLSSHATSTSSSSSVKYFDIRLNNDYVVFRGPEDEATGAPLSGNVVLCLTEALNVQHIKLTLTGIISMSYMVPSTSAMSGRRTGSKEKCFYEKTWTFQEPSKGKSESLSPDNYEWPFQIILEGNLPESVEGMRGAHVIYRLKAEICRKRGKDIVVRKPLRIVRTLSSTALELTHAMSVENVWPQKVEYAISTPRKAVVFGSFIQVDFKLIPLLKGLLIGNIATQLKEEQELVLDPEWGITALNGGVLAEDRVVAYDNYKIDPNVDEQILDETAEGYQFSRYLELPKSLNECLQDCNVKGIRVRHKLKFNVQLLNPDGHISELRANLPITLYISPNLPLNADNNLIDQSPQAGRAAIENDQLNTAPPIYGQHILDQLYSDVDRSGYQTPGQVLSTVGTPYSQSRNISNENLANLDALTSSGAHVSAAALQSRLQSLRLADPTTLTPSHDDLEQPRSGIISRGSSQPRADYFSPHNSTGGQSPQAQISSSQRSSPTSSSQVSRSNSHDNGTPSGSRTPYTAASNHYEGLDKVPSYSTAVRTPVARHFSGDGLPTYGAAMRSSPPSPPTNLLHSSFSAAGQHEVERRASRVRPLRG